MVNQFKTKKNEQLNQRLNQEFTNLSQLEMVTEVVRKMSRDGAGIQASPHF